VSAADFRVNRSADIAGTSRQGAAPRAATPAALAKAFGPPAISAREGGPLWSFTGPEGKTFTAYTSRTGASVGGKGSAAAFKTWLAAELKPKPDKQSARGIKARIQSLFSSTKPKAKPRRPAAHICKACGHKTKASK
jgi:hypothetical protein